MDPVRFGLAIRALRRRRGWTQAELGERADLSGSAISRVERGSADRLSLRALRKITDALGARLVLRVQWQGEELDRILDADHARLVEWVVRRLAACGWKALPEVTYRSGSERGSIDVFGWHPTLNQLLVVEVKSVVPDVQATLAGVDRKARLAPVIARERGWSVGAVSRILVLPEDRTARRRLAQFSGTFERALPARTVEIRRWLDDPRGSIAGVLFVSGVTQAGARHRVRARSGDPERAQTTRSRHLTA